MIQTKDQNKEQNKKTAQAITALVLTGALANMAMKHHDDFVDRNAGVASRAGLKCYLVRTEHGEGCSFCDDLAGEYEYEHRPDGIRARHKNCKCTIEFRVERKSGFRSGRSRVDKAARNDRVKKEQHVDFYAGPRYTQVIPEQYSEWIGDNKYEYLMKNAAGEEAKKYIRTAYRKSSVIGDGGAVAIRKFEKATGLNCGRNNNDHSLKVKELINLINNSLRKNNLSVAEKEYLQIELEALKKVL